MSKTTLVDWTESQVQLKFDAHREVKYKVFRDKGRHYLEVCEVTGESIHTLELPAGMKLDKSSYEVLLRYVMLDVVAA